MDKKTESETHKSLIKEKARQLLNELDASPKSIIRSSDYFIKIAKEDHDDMMLLIKEWQSYFVYWFSLQDAKKLINLLFLLNDIFQKTKLYKRKVFRDQFAGGILEKIVENVGKSKLLKLKLQVGNLLRIWQSRRIFTEECIAKLISLLGPEGVIPKTQIDVPLNLISYVRNKETCAKWDRESKRLEGQLMGLVDEPNRECIEKLKDFKKAGELRQKYQTKKLRDLTSILKDQNANHLSLLKKLQQTTNLIAKIRKARKGIEAVV